MYQVMNRKFTKSYTGFTKLFFQTMFVSSTHITNYNSTVLTSHNSDCLPVDSVSSCITFSLIFVIMFEPYLIE